MKIIVGLFTKNIVLKFVAIILATAFWFIVQAEQIDSIQRKVQVSLITPDDVIIEGGKERTVGIRLQGPKAILATYLEGTPFQASISIPHKQTGKPIRIRLQKQYIQSIHDRVGVEFDEQFVVVLLHQKIKKRLAVRPILIGKPKDGYTVEKIIVEPPEIELEGGDNELTSLTEVNNVSLNITNLSQSTQFEDVLLDLSNLKTVSIKNQTITIKLLIGEEKLNKKFANIRVKLLNETYKAYFSPRTVAIEVQGTRGVMNFIKSRDFQAVLDIKGILPETKINKKVQIKIPSKTTLIEIIPEWITVTVSKTKK